MKLTRDNKGVSLAITIGLLLLLITLTATINVLVIQALRASHTIEASDKSYFAAEAGIEDALYELSIHSAGYETPLPPDPGYRNDDFTQTVPWRNEWIILNRGLNECTNGLDTWDTFTPQYCGRMYGGQKLVINLFTDDAVADTQGVNEINETVADINKLPVTQLTLRFRVPPSVVTNPANSGAFGGGQPLMIDNDEDSFLNEDGVEDTDFCGGTVELDDGDCDGREDEDSEEDPVFLWSLVDDAGNTFQPLRGCKGDAPHPSHNDVNATLCEKNFTKPSDEVYVELDQDDRGLSTVGGSSQIESLADFIASVPNTNRLQMEVLVVAPMAAYDSVEGRTVPIPYYEYGLDYDAGGAEVPSTFFSLQSDGYYRDFKQSITTNVVPRATTRLLDLTIIQQ